MATRQEISVETLENLCWSDALKKSVNFDEVKEGLACGKRLVLEESSFTDPGEDYSAVYLDEKNILYIRGY